MIFVTSLNSHALQVERPTPSTRASEAISRPDAVSMPGGLFALTAVRVYPLSKIVHVDQTAVDLAW
jgi:hypothetical protein